jgi:molybdate/tungstate transport system substrate-binding protein
MGISRSYAMNIVTALVATACAVPDASSERVLVVFNAGSLARPLRAALDTFSTRNGVRVEQENAGSIESARKLTELGRTPDVIALADYEVFPKLLIPSHLTWYAQFARNRMVLAYTDRSAGATEVDSTNWWRIALRPKVETGYADPNLDPAGYRTLLVFQLAELHYGEPGLAERLKDAVPLRNVRPKSADLVALLQTGEFDYAWEYESVAQSASLKYVVLPTAIDLSDPGSAATYARAEVRVRGATPADSLTFRGEPIVYALSIPTNAMHRELAEQFVAFLFSAEGKAIMRRAQLDVLESPVMVGSEVPSKLLEEAPSNSATHR